MAMNDQDPRRISLCIERKWVDVMIELSGAENTTASGYVRNLIDKQYEEVKDLTPEDPRKRQKVKTGLVLTYGQYEKLMHICDVYDVSMQQAIIMLLKNASRGQS